MKWRDLIERECEQCGRKFLVIYGKVLEGKARFCSYSCSGKYSKITKISPAGTKQEKINANGRINYKVRKHQIDRPNKCEICGNLGRLDGHHFNYQKPDEVMWLCRSCHMKIHAKKVH